MFKKEYDYSIIEDIELDDLDLYLGENYFITDVFKNESCRWAGFSQYFGLEQGLNPVECESFGSMVAFFITGKYCPSSTDQYYDENRIRDKIQKQKKEIMALDVEEEEKVRLLFYYIFSIYKEGLENYEKSITALTVKLTYSQQKKFMSVKGYTKAEKFRNLLDYYMENHK